MADFKDAQGVKTHYDDDLAGKIVDGQSGATATDKLSIVGEGDTVTGDTNDWGIPAMFETESGTYIIPKTDDNGAQKVVVVSDDDDVAQHSYKNHSAVAEDGTDDHDTVITSGKKVNKVKLTLSSLGLFKYQIGTWDGVSTFTIMAVLFTEPASPSICCEVEIPETTGDGTLALRVRATNKDEDDNDAYSTISFVEYV